MGVTSVGVFAKTKAPVPVSSVTAEIRFALEGVARKVATFAARPETPVLMGNPVQLVRVPLVGVPRMGVTRVGVSANTSAPVPVSPVTAAARLALEGVARKVATLEPRPLTPVEIGRPVQLVSVPEAGVPSVGVVRTGDVSVLFVKVCASAKTTTVSVASGNVIVLVAVDAVVSVVCPVAPSAQTIEAPAWFRLPFSFTGTS